MRTSMFDRCQTDIPCFDTHIDINTNDDINECHDDDITFKDVNNDNKISNDNYLFQGLS